MGCKRAVASNGAGRGGEMAALSLGSWQVCVCVYNILSACACVFVIQ